MNDETPTSGKIGGASTTDVLSFDEALKFELGLVVITNLAMQQLDSDDVQMALFRHNSGDWGDVCQEDQATNDEALAYGYRLLSAYGDRNGTKFWIITEWDRSVTTILLPSEY